MKSFFNTPVDQLLANSWKRIDQETKKAFFFVVGVNLLAFGFEMTNLTLHHDDLTQIFIQDTILGHFLGRFGVGPLHLYTQNAYFIPFIQMLEGIVFMTAYGLLVARFWGLRKAMDITLVAAILCVLPFMAQVYQYNTSMATYSLAHLLAALAVTLSTRATVAYVATAAVFYTAAFSVYQSVIANAAAIFGVWALVKLLYADAEGPFFSKRMMQAAIAAIVAVGAGGVLYLFGVSLMDLEFDSYQAADQAFSLKGISNFSYAIEQVIEGSRAFFFWPENYFPSYLKKAQLLFLVAAGILCLWLPKGLLAKIAAMLVLGLTLLAPRMLQLLHSAGTYHNLALTGYAVVIAGFVMIVNRAGPVVVRNFSTVLACFLIAGYVLQSNWISTVNYLNTLAHYSTLTQMLARIRSVPDAQWDGKRIAVVGSYDMTSAYPYKSATGVATEFLDAKHMQALARLMRDDVSFVTADRTMPKILEYAKTQAEWPDPSSVSVVDGLGVVILSKKNIDSSRHLGPNRQ